MFTVRGQTFLDGRMLNEYTQHFDTQEEAREHALEIQKEFPRMIVMVEFNDRYFNESTLTNWVARSVMTH